MATSVLAGGAFGVAPGEHACIHSTMPNIRDDSLCMAFTELPFEVYRTPGVPPELRRVPATVRANSGRKPSLSIGDLPMFHSIIYLGLDVHKDPTTIAVLPEAAPAPSRAERLSDTRDRLLRSGPHMP